MSYPFHSRDLEADWDIYSKSSNPIIDTSEVSLKSAMNVLTIAGIEIFRACGNIINIVILILNLSMFKKIMKLLSFTIQK